MSVHRLRVLVTLACWATLVSSIEAQWLNHPTPGIPRLPDGGPNLSAPTPRTNGYPRMAFPSPFKILQVTIDDRKAFLKPWTVQSRLQYLADSELLEGFCDNHDKTMEHRRITPPPPEPPSPR